MFSGIVNSTKEITNIIASASKKTIEIFLGEEITTINIGDSVAVNGVCLTVTRINQQAASFDIVPQTLQITNLDALAIGNKVNIEFSLRYGAPVGGHMVQGHVDCTILIQAIEQNGDEWRVFFQLPPAYKNLLIEKGFIALDGMSLTVQSISEEHFMVVLIPHTRQVTIANNYKVGTRVNFEVDMMAKYITRYLEKGND
jgi:riboflavin synthase alpha subunit